MKAGSRFRSTNSTVEIIVVKAPAGEPELTCAGAPMEPASGPKVAGSTPEGAPEDDVLLVGKRYVEAENGIEALCTAAGLGPVCINGQRLTLAQPKLLPSSD